MGRELKRVDLSNPPRAKEVWSGYTNPFEVLCKTCINCEDGYSKPAKTYHDQWYGKAHFNPIEYGARPVQIDDKSFRVVIRRKVERSIELSKAEGGAEWYTNGGALTLEDAISREEKRVFDIIKGQWCHHLIQADVDALADGDRLVQFTRDWYGGGYRWKKGEGVAMTADDVNAWSLGGLGHDSISAAICIKARCKRGSEPYACSDCKGTCESWDLQEHKVLRDEWRSTEPPLGDGYQLWETASGGSPVSPAFKALEELDTWLVQNDESTTKDNELDSWMRSFDFGRH